MNVALWPATLGYWMETMLAPAFSEGAIEATRAFFNRYVIGGGACPAIRIGEQPYGILPTTAISRMAWFDRRGDIGGAAGGAGGPTPEYLRHAVPGPAAASTRTCGRRRPAWPTSVPPAIPTRSCSTSSVCTRARSSGHSATPRA